MAASIPDMETILPEAHSPTPSPAPDGADVGFRRHPRSRRLLMVDYLIKNRVYRDFIENVSGGGVYISTRSPFEIGQEVVVTYQLPELRSPVRNKGVVVRKGREGIGVKFTWN